MILSRRSLAFDIAIGAALLAILALLPLLFPSKALVDFMIRGAALALFATSLNLLVGYGGMVSFGHGMFFGLGAYSFALLMQRTGMPIPAAFAITLVMCAAAAFVIGLVCVPLKELYFAFLTLAFQMLVHSLIVLWVPLTGGDQGSARRHPAAAFSRHQPRQSNPSLLNELRVARNRSRAHSSHCSIAVRLYAANDP